jgi:hypothetical protein
LLRSGNQPSSDGGRENRNRIAWPRGNLSETVAAALIVFLCLAQFVPFSPSFPSDGLDDGWVLGINAAVERGMSFGRDIVFTFGPYASTYTRQYGPSTDLLMLLSSGLIALSFAIGIIVLTHGRHRWFALTLALTLDIFARDDFFLIIPLVLVVLVCRILIPTPHPLHLPTTNFVRWSLALLTTAASLLPLIKGTFGVACVILGVIICALLIARQRAAIAISGLFIFLAGLSTFWVLAGQSLSQLPVFFTSQAPIMSGYSDAMSLIGSPGELSIFLVTCALLLAVNFSMLRSANLPGLALAAAVASVLFLSFKAGFVRQDSHALIGAGALAMVGLVLAIGVPDRRSLVGLAICLTAWVMITRDHTKVNFWTLRNQVISHLLTQEEGAGERIEDSGRLRNEFEESLATIRTAHPLPPLKGKTDVYSFGQSILLANGFDWAPRSVLQSYSAYTPSLLKADAAHLAGSTAPENILFTVQPIDGRLAALEDGLSWPGLLTRYAPSDSMDGAAILKRRSRPTTDQPVISPPIVSGAYRLGEEISIPVTNEPLWARIAVRPTLLGKIAALVWKLPELQIELRLVDGTMHEFRYIAGMGKTGFVVSPLIQDTSEFLALESPNRRSYLAEMKVQSLSISVAKTAFGHGYWEKALSVQVSKMDIPTQSEVSRILVIQPFVRDGERSEAIDALPTNDCWFDQINHYAADKIPATIKRTLIVSGWAAISFGNGIAPDRTKITLTGKDGRVYSVEANITVRKDVAQNFGRPEMGNVGFEVTADISAFEGPYTLGIQVSADAQKRECARRLPIAIAAVNVDKG